MIPLILFCMVLATPAASQTTPPAPPQAGLAIQSKDLRVVQRAETILNAPDKWNRTDTGACATNAAKFSIYCAEQRASIEVTGGFHHRRPALELVRQIVDERSRGREYNHRLMDYNNDPSTHLADMRKPWRE